MKKYNVGIIGATGMVGQRFATLLADHPWFDVKVLAASPRSAGKSYKEAVGKKWAMTEAIPERLADIIVKDAAADISEIAAAVDFVFCAVDMKKDEIKALEEAYAKAECPVISNNSANRFTPDVPMVIPEINADHIKVIKDQRKRLGTKRGFVAVKSNCSLQSYVPAIYPLDKKYGVKEVLVCTYQAISGAGKTFETWPEMNDNVIPFIGGEEEKSEKEPLKIWGKVENGEIALASSPLSPLSASEFPFPTDIWARCLCALRTVKSPQRKKSSARGTNMPAERRSLIFRARRSSFCTILPRTICPRPSFKEALRAEWQFPSADCARIRSTTTNSFAFHTTH